jgi:hypothetical protein
MEEDFMENKTSYREAKIGKVLYLVDEEFTGEKELGTTLENLAARFILSEMTRAAHEALIAS